jgi:carbon storage regulator
MLVLTRRTREIVTIGEDIQVMVLDIDGDRVRLGLTAPCELKIQRQERTFARAAPITPAGRP